MKCKRCYSGEVTSEMKKDFCDMMQDTYNEANNLNTEGNEKAGRHNAPKELNLDIMKHLLKRLDYHQVAALDKARKTNILIFVLMGASLLVSIASLIISIIF